MTDIDSYLLKCALESIEAGVPTEDIQEECECLLGLKVDHHNDNNNE